MMTESTEYWIFRSDLQCPKLILAPKFYLLKAETCKPLLANKTPSEEELDLKVIDFG